VFQSVLKVFYVKLYVYSLVDELKLKVTFCDHATHTKSIIQKSHPPSLDHEQVADADALVCVSRGHCDGLGGGGVLLNTQLYLPWEQRSAACEPSPALCLIHLKTSSCRILIRENIIQSAECRIQKRVQWDKKFLD